MPIADLVAHIVRTSRALAERNVIDAVELRPGATPEELESLEKNVGRPLPPSLRVLLTHTNGAPRLLIFADLLSVSEMLPGSPAHGRAEVLKAVNLDAGPAVPREALVIADKGGDRPDCVYLDPRKQTAEGEWRVVSFDHQVDDQVDDDIVALLERTLASFERMLAETIELEAELDAGGEKNAPG